MKIYQNKAMDFGDDPLEILLNRILTDFTNFILNKNIFIYVRSENVQISFTVHDICLFVSYRNARAHRVPNRTIYGVFSRTWRVETGHKSGLISGSRLCDSHKSIDSVSACARGLVRNYRRIVHTEP